MRMPGKRPLPVLLAALFLWAGIAVPSRTSVAVEAPSSAVATGAEEAPPRTVMPRDESEPPAVPARMGKAKEKSISSAPSPGLPPSTRRAGVVPSTEEGASPTRGPSAGETVSSEVTAEQAAVPLAPSAGSSGTGSAPGVEVPSGPRPPDVGSGEGSMPEEVPEALPPEPAGEAALPPVVITEEGIQVPGEGGGEAWEEEGPGEADGEEEQDREGPLPGASAGGMTVPGGQGPLVPPKVDLGLTPQRFDYPDDLLRPRWRECLLAIQEGPPERLQAALNRLYEAKLDSGYRNFPEYAALLVRRAHDRLEGRDLLAARLFGQTAYHLAPEFYPVPLFLAELAGKDPEEGLGRAVSWRWVALKRRLTSFLWGFRTLGRLFSLLLMGGYLLFLFLGPYFLGRYGGLLVHLLRERLPGGTGGLAVVALLALAAIGVLLLLPGPFWATVILGFCCGRFARIWERVLFLGFLVIWAFSPFLLSRTVSFFSPLSAPTKALRGCIEGAWDASDEEALKEALRVDPDAVDLLLVQALVEKRRGRYGEAAAVLERAVDRYPKAGALWNNLGNIYAIQGKIGEAKRAYERASRSGGDRAAPHYNLSQILRREFYFLRGGQEFQIARRLDAERVDYFTYIHSRNPNRFFMDEEPSPPSLWHHAFARDPDVTRAAEGLWDFLCAGIALRQAPWVFLALAAVYLLLVAGGRGWDLIACSTCGRIISGGESAGGSGISGMCAGCYRALYQGDQIPKERRHEQLRRMGRYQSRRSRVLLILNLLFPGVGYSLLRERAAGIFIFLGFILLGLWIVLWHGILPIPVIVWETTGASGGSWLAAGCLVFLYGWVQKRFVGLMRAGR